MKHRKHQRSARGFSMLELAVVVAISMVVMAMILPNAINAGYNIRLRSSANDLAGLLQQARFRAIRDNTYYPICYATASAATGNANLFYIDIRNRTCAAGWSSTFTDAQGNVVGYPTSQPGGNVQWQSAGMPNSTLSTMALGYTPVIRTDGIVAYFGPRGTPCSMNGAICMNTFTAGGATTIASYAMFLNDTRPTGGNGWAAVTISPAGRTRVWMWSGTAWQ